MCEESNQVTVKQVNNISLSNQTTCTLNEKVNMRLQVNHIYYNQLIS